MTCLTLGIHCLVNLQEVCLQAFMTGLVNIHTEPNVFNLHGEGFREKLCELGLLGEWSRSQGSQAGRTYMAS